MKYPRLIANKEALKHNAQIIIKMCHDINVELTAVVKVTCGEPRLAKMYTNLGVDMIGDSRIDNILRMRHANLKGPFVLLRIPMISEIPDVVENTDVVLVSELETVRFLGKEANKRRKTQKILYMVDVGDLREGVWYENAVDEIEEASKIDGVVLYGIGTNLGCYGGVIPDKENMNLLVKIAKALRARGVSFKIVSGGNTAALYLMEKQILPKGINGYRLGESLILGTDVTNNRAFPFLRQDTFTLQTEIVELKNKPSVPKGKIGRDAMGRTPVFEDLGNRLKAIVAIGEQDVPSDGLRPIDKGVKVLHASSDHTVLDVTDFEGHLRVGDILEFKVTYSALLRAMTSPYVTKDWSQIES